MNKKLRIPLIAGNWKMYKTACEAVDLVSGIKLLVPSPGDCEVVVAPPYLSIPVVVDCCRDSYIGVAAQNMHWEEEGAFTGEVSAVQLVNIGCEWVVIGHSERRRYFAETDESVSKKTAVAIKHAITPIMCIGETLSEREGGRTFEVIERQLGMGLPSLSPEDYKKIVVAYEPVWAIGTGKTASPAQAEEVHTFIRSFLVNQLGADSANAIRILYGGSVKADNAKELLSCENIDGALVGGASLKADSFCKIIQAAKG